MFPRGGGGAGAVASVNGQTGVVVLDAADVTAVDSTGSQAFGRSLLTKATAADLRAAALVDRAFGFYNVLAYGAVGDGTTDDTAACQSAIDACAAGGGGIVQFPHGAAGRYFVPGGLVVSTSGVLLSGAGWHTQRQDGDAAASRLEVAAGSTVSPISFTGAAFTPGAQGTYAQNSGMMLMSVRKRETHLVLTPCTLSRAADTVNKGTNDGLANGMAVVPTGMVNTTGLTNGSLYYIVNVTATTAQFAATVGGAAILLAGTADDANVTLTTSVGPNNNTPGIAIAGFECPKIIDVNVFGFGTAVKATSTVQPKIERLRAEVRYSTSAVTTAVGFDFDCTNGNFSSYLHSSSVFFQGNLGTNAYGVYAHGALLTDIFTELCEVGGATVGYNYDGTAATTAPTDLKIRSVVADQCKFGVQIVNLNNGDSAGFGSWCEVSGVNYASNTTGGQALRIDNSQGVTARGVQAYDAYGTGSVAVRIKTGSLNVAVSEVVARGLWGTGVQATDSTKLTLAGVFLTVTSGAANDYMAFDNCQGIDITGGAATAGIAGSTIAQGFEFVETTAPCADATVKGTKLGAGVTTQWTVSANSTEIRRYGVPGLVDLPYGKGDGGTVTQLTSKSTGVTLNKICGQITTNNAVLNAGATVGFTLTNSQIAATDSVELSIASGGTTNSYIIFADAIAAGSCHILIRNITSAANLSEAIVIAFEVRKLVNA